MVEVTVFSIKALKLHAEKVERKVEYLGAYLAVLLVILSVRKRKHELIDQWANEMDGLVRGCNDGHTEGCELGFKIAGWKEECADGDEDGLHDGISLGFNIGCPLGVQEGMELGWKDGVLEGFIEGRLVGSTLG